MKTRLVVAGAVVMLVIAGSAWAQQSTDEALVRKTVEAYLHGLKFNDVASLGSTQKVRQRLAQKPDR